MDPVVRNLLLVIFGPFILLLTIGLAISNTIVIQVAVGYIMCWLVFASFVYNFFTKFNISYSRWVGQDISKLSDIEKIEIPIGGDQFLKGDIIKCDATPEKAPVVIMCHGLGGSRTDFYMVAMALVYRGYAWVCYDSRGHGESEHIGEKSDSLYIINDLESVLDFIETRDDLDKSRIVAIGASMGASIVLNKGYLEPRIDFVIGLCAWSDFQATATRKLNTIRERAVKIGYKMMGINLDPSNLQNRMVSPILYSFNRKKGFFGHPYPWEVDNDYRVMLAHCKDDSIINFINFEKNRDFLNMPPSNCLVFDWGDHAFAQMETCLMGKLTFWLASRGY
jgi:pimeloyl-ACP methyl ester carboxylesterase